MPRNSEHGFEAGDVATTAPFGDLTSMKRKRKTGKAKSDLEEVKADSFEEDDPQDKSYELGTRKKGTKRSPARKQAKVEPSPDLPTANRRKKKLSLLPTMPLDILFEIFGNLPPKDILNVSRASKTFRQTLMTRRATTVWKTACDRIGAPECPSWMSQPAWAALLFGHNCQSCGTSNIQNVDFLLLKRVCMACKRTHLLRSKAAKRYPDILDLVSPTNTWNHRRPSRNRYYWDTDLEAMDLKLSNLKERPNSQKMLLDFKEEQKQRVTQIQQAAPQWDEWFNIVKVEGYNARIEQRTRHSGSVRLEINSGIGCSYLYYSSD